MDEIEFDEVAESIKALTHEGKYEETLALLLKKIRSARSNNDQNGVDAYIRLARGILVLVESDFGASRMKPKNPTEKHCSFCGNEEEPDLVAGAEAMICVNCSKLISDIFRERGNT